jgi:histone deacetylase complex regulatory component SIN3
MQNNKPSTSDTGKVANELESGSRGVSETFTTSRARAASNIASSLSFIDTVKNRSAKDNKPEVYDGFIQLMQEFHLQR